MVLENVFVEQLIKVNLPGPKQRKVVSVPWESSDMPSTHILVNTQTIKQHTQKCEKNKETEKDIECLLTIFIMECYEASDVFLGIVQALWFKCADEKLVLVIVPSSCIEPCCPYVPF